MLDLERVVACVGEVFGDAPGELAVGGGSGQGGDCLQVLIFALAKDEGGRGIISRRVRDGIRLASLDGLGEYIDLKGCSSDNEGSASEESLDEKHID